ncbi:hypothetical protein HYDPIDRAFT_110701 [Hydnomerulius pinastri MD-312]|nr:hypothetical protein HYDPIDRAFT_110701 [Hydnomerulius pinastri MD-312]
MIRLAKELDGCTHFLITIACVWPSLVVMFGNEGSLPLEQRERLSITLLLNNGEAPMAIFFVPVRAC